MKTIEQISTSERSLTPEVSRRVIFCLASINDSPLEPQGAYELFRLLRGDTKDRAHSSIIFDKGRYYIELLEQAESEEAALSCAVAETDTALLKTMLPAEFEAAWIVTPDSPHVNQIPPNVLRDMESVTPIARNLFASHHQEAMEASFTRMLFDVA